MHTKLAREIKKCEVLARMTKLSPPYPVKNNSSVTIMAKSLIWWGGGHPFLSCLRKEKIMLKE